MKFKLPWMLSATKPTSRPRRKSPPPVRLFRTVPAACGGLEMSVTAPTKSEARSLLKRELKLARLPAGWKLKLVSKEQ